MDLTLTFGTLAREFVTLFVVIDPVGSIPVFLFAAAAVPKHLRVRFAVRAVVIAAAVLMAFLVFGQFLLEGIGLRLGSFQVAGGLILFLFALTMIFGESKPAREIGEASHDNALAGAVFPLAMPSIASPGAMLAIVVLTENDSNTLVDQAVTAILLVVVLAITLALLLIAAKLQSFLGQTGVSVISRIMGLILATVAVDATLGGLETLELISIPGAGTLDVGE